MKKLVLNSGIDSASIAERFCPSEEEIERFYSLRVDGLYSCWGEIDVDPEQVISNIKEFVKKSIANAFDEYINQSIPCTSNAQNNTERTYETVQCQ